VKAPKDQAVAGTLPGGADLPRRRLARASRLLLPLLLLAGLLAWGKVHEMSSLSEGPGSPQGQPSAVPVKQGPQGSMSPMTRKPAGAYDAADPREAALALLDAPGFWPGANESRAVAGGDTSPSSPGPERAIRQASRAEPATADPGKGTEPLATLAHRAMARPALTRPALASSVAGGSVTAKPGKRPEKRRRTPEAVADALATVEIHAAWQAEHPSERQRP
jgi:hypothetical protein